jgi:CheY-like chemotaxis protein
VVAQGSTFVLTLPLMPADLGTGLAPDPSRLAVLVIDDDDADLLMYERALVGTQYQTVPVRSAAAAVKALESIVPAAIVLDIHLHGDDAWDFLAKLKHRPPTDKVPVLVISSIEDSHKAMALGADGYRAKPIDADWLRRTLGTLVHRDARRVLIVDDQEASRFIMREILGSAAFEVFEAPDGRAGLDQARRVRPDVILLDLHLGDMDGLAVREALRQDVPTAGVPVVVITSRPVTPAERELLGHGTAILSKADLTRERLCAAVADAMGTERAS